MPGAVSSTLNQTEVEMRAQQSSDAESGSFPSERKLVLSWSELSYSIGGGGKIILDNLTGKVYGGEVLAIMGPSGSGKTTLLDVVAGRVNAGLKGRDVRGTIGLAPGTKMRYVQQEDSLVGILSVRETLVFAARLAGAPDSRVDELLADLGLSVCSDTHVGTIFFKGISGGQKRRLSIAVELISQPSLLLLDEPTSGLDSASALQVIQVLKAMCAKRGVAVACSLHQPGHDAWSLLDQVSFMAGGKLVYFGRPGGRLLSFLDVQGYPVPQHCNVADFVLALINQDFKDAGVKTADVGALAAAFKGVSAQDPEVLEVVQVVSRKASSAITTSSSNPSGGGAVRAGVAARLWYLMGRDARETLRDPGILGVRLAMYTMLSVLIALMFWGIGGDKRDEDVVARVSVLFYVAAFMVFMSVAVLPFFVMQRPIFVKERCNGAYGVAEYVLSKFLTSIPGIALLAVVSGCLIVIPSGLNGLRMYILDLFLSLMWAEAFMCLMAAIVPHYIIGIALGAGVFGFFMLCEGFFKLKADIPPYLIWGYHMAPHTYTFRTFMYNEFHPIKKLDSLMYEDGDAVLKFYSMEDTKMGRDMLVLLCCALGTQLLFAAVLQKFHTGLR